MKICTKCKEAKPLTAFGNDKNFKDGLRCNCKLCRKAENAQNRIANHDAIKAKEAIYRATHPNRAKNYDIANKEAIKIRRAIHYVVNRARLNANVAEYMANNKAAIKAYQADYRVKNLDKFRIKQQNRRARKLQTGGKLSHGLRAKLFKLQRGLCPCCKQPLGDNHHLDHIMPLALGGANTDDNMQLLRATCNHQKCAKHPVDFMQARGFLL